MIGRAILIAWIVAACAASAPAGNWTVARVNSVTLPEPSSGNVREMSGVTYVGPAGSAHRFIAVQQNHQNVVRFDVTFTAAGGIASIANVVNIPIDDKLDFEGIAYTNAARNSVFVSEETNPGVREINLSNGDTLQTVTVPGVFANRRDNKGLESLTRTRDATTMWTANEESLSVDGPASSGSAPIAVRLLRLDVAGNAVTAGSQFAYLVEPFHAGPIDNNRSGLSDLVAMPDGTVLSLERSFADATPPTPDFLNRIFEISFAGATDISQGATASGLAGKTYTPVGKQLLWAGSVNATNAGQNFEGIGLGPRLPNGAWALIGVVDSGSDAGNTVVALSAVPNLTADFDLDGDADGDDYLAWQRGLGKTIGAKLSEGDADRDGDVDADDLGVWRAAQATAPAKAAPEPDAAALLMTGLLSLPRRRNKTQSDR